jgi:hypothetical protein
MPQATRVEIQGTTRLALTLAGAAHRLGDMSAPGRAAAGVVAASAAARAPHRTGRLAGSMRGTADDKVATISSGLVYAPVIHFGWPGHNISPNPFGSRALTDTEPVTVRGYLARVDQVLAGVKGV